MNVEHLTNEELAEALIEVEREFVWPHDGGDAKAIFEAARRLRNSIPKPAVVVTFDDFDNAYYIVVNNQRCGRFIYDRIMANTLADDILQALGLEGGGDE